MVSAATFTTQYNTSVRSQTSRRPSTALTSHSAQQHPPTHQHSVDVHVNNVASSPPSPTETTALYRTGGEEIKLTPRQPPSTGVCCPMCL